MKSINFIIVIILVISANSCATIFTGTKQTIQINSEPSDANVKINGIDKGKTPLIVKLKKGNDSEIISVEKEGYEKKVLSPETDFNTVAALNFFNLLWWGIDIATGAIWKYDPDYYYLKLEKEK
jgi:hypothetical protein